MTAARNIRSRSPSRSSSPASRRDASGGIKFHDADVSSFRGRRTAAPAPLSLEKSTPGNEEGAPKFPVSQPKSPCRAKAVDASPGGLTIDKSAKELGRYAEVTASAMMKFEAMLNRHRYPKSVHETRSPSPLRRRSNSPLPGAAGVGWGFLTERQRPNLSADWLRGNDQKPFYEWDKSFEAASNFPRSPSACWGREGSLRSQPEQWVRDKKRCDGARVDGRRPTLSPAVRRSASARSEAGPSRSASPDKRSHHPNMISASGRHVSSQHETSLPRTVPKPIPMGKDRAEDQWRTHWQHQLTGSAGYTVSHPDWSKRGGRSFGKSKRIVIEPMPSGGKAGLSSRKSRSPSPSPQSGRSPSPKPVKV
eukprot:TRINITY_DN29534_c0_g1_i1.p1 TRINITY_DN29534_c0_g1~~TRINITY_DN29534_c0_g1_i1.p1  ORF type:complete len:364 (+),score=9.53 TRINITY_DN29534_c0_g1_i1:30-1121(+)